MPLTPYIYYASVLQSNGTTGTVYRPTHTILSAIVDVFVAKSRWCNNCDSHDIAVAGTETTDDGRRRRDERRRRTTDDGGWRGWGEGPRAAMNQWGK